MDSLDWRDDRDGYICQGYRLVARPDASCWRLYSPGSNRAIGAGRPPAVTDHRTAHEAMVWAHQLESEETRRAAVGIHFSTSGIALVAFVVLANEIGSLHGLALVSVAFYLTLRSAANGIGLLLKDAWGWTRLGVQRSTLLERWVQRAATRRRRRALASVESAGSVRLLDPVSTRRVDV